MNTETAEITITDDFGADLAFTGLELGDFYHEQNGYGRWVTVYQTAAGQYAAALYSDRYNEDIQRRAVSAPTATELADAILDIDHRFLTAIKRAFKDAELVWAKRVD